MLKDWCLYELAMISLLRYIYGWNTEDKANFFCDILLKLNLR